jgi:spore germination protein YaaH
MRPQWSRTSAHFMLLILLLIKSTPASARLPGDHKGRKRIDTWLVLDEENGFARIERNADILNSLSVFGKPSQEFIDNCHRLHIEVYQAVSGDTTSIDTPAHRQTTVDQYVHACKTLGYDGIDLDFEHMDSAFREQYSEFLRLASTTLHGMGKKLSHCVGCYPTADWNAHKPTFYDPKVIAKTCDLIRVMCYDLYWAPGRGDPHFQDRPDVQGMGPTSSYLWAREGMRFWMAHAPREKLVMGLPAYSNDYALSPNGPGKQVYGPRPEIADLAAAQKSWLWYERLPIYLYAEKDGILHLFYASDAESTKAHLETVDELNLPSLGFWHFSSVDKATWEALRNWLGKP